MYSPDRRYAVRSDNQTLVICEPAKSRDIARFPNVIRLPPVWTPDGEHCLWAGGDGSLLSIDLRSGRRRNVGIKLANTGQNQMRFSPDGKYATMGGNASRVATLYRIKGDAFTPIREYPDVLYAEFLPSGRQLLSLSRTLRVYSLDAEPTVPTSKHPNPGFVQISPEGKSYIVQGRSIVEDDLLRGTTRRDVAKVKLDTALIDSNAQAWVEFSYGRGRYKMGFFDSPGREWTLLADSTIYGDLFDVTPNRGFVVLGNKVFDLTTGRSWTYPLESPVSTATFSPDGRHVLIGDQQGMCKLWQVLGTRKEPEWTFQDATRWPTSLPNFSSDGKRVVFASGEISATVLDVRTGERLLSLSGHSGTIMSTVWSPDGQRIATCGADGSVRIWDGKTGLQLSVIGRHEGGAMCARFLPGGRTLASIGHDGTVKLWMTEDRP
ncbi:hypothetical protein EON82_22225 [bacterium]|nr:MAG: hypothetical protein EON82_22225 [bacterium]